MVGMYYEGRMNKKKQKYLKIITFAGHVVTCL